MGDVSAAARAPAPPRGPAWGLRGVARVAVLDGDTATLRTRPCCCGGGADGCDGGWAWWRSRLEPRPPAANDAQLLETCKGRFSKERSRCGGDIDDTEESPEQRCGTGTPAQAPLLAEVLLQGVDAFLASSPPAAAPAGPSVPPGCSARLRCCTRARHAEGPMCGGGHTTTACGASARTAAWGGAEDSAAAPTGGPGIGVPAGAAGEAEGAVGAGCATNAEGATPIPGGVLDANGDGAVGAAETCAAEADGGGDAPTARIGSTGASELRNRRSTGRGCPKATDAGDVVACRAGKLVVGNALRRIVVSRLGPAPQK